MSRKKTSKPDDPEQSARFVELAEKVKAENDGELFEETVRKLIKAPKHKKAASKET